jgi:SET domain-containing protein
MKRAELVRRVLADCYCRLAPSTIHGIGVFAIRDIPRGKNPFNTISKYSRPGYVRMTSAELDALPPKLHEMIHALFVPTDGEMWLPSCGTNVVYLNTYLNHSTEPNLRTKDGFRFTALRKISEGEELTVDYLSYGVDGLITAELCEMHNNSSAALERRPRGRVPGLRAGRLRQA